MPDNYKGLIRELVEEIKTGVFAKDWQLEQLLGYPVFNKLLDEAFNHPINNAERKLKEHVKLDL
jgi:ketol-acid reductoisomerase